MVREEGSAIVTAVFPSIHMVRVILHPKNPDFKYIKIDVYRFEQWREFDLTVKVVTGGNFIGFPAPTVSIKATPSDTLHEVLNKASIPSSEPMIQVRLPAYSESYYQGERCLWELGVVRNVNTFTVESTGNK